MALRRGKINVGSLTLSEGVAVEFQKLKFYRSSLVEALLKELFSRVSAEALLLELAKSSADDVVKKYLAESSSVNRKSEAHRKETSYREKLSEIFRL